MNEPIFSKEYQFFINYGHKLDRKLSLLLYGYWEKGDGSRIIELLIEAYNKDIETCTIEYPQYSPAKLHLAINEAYWRRIDKISDAEVRNEVAAVFDKPMNKKLPPMPTTHEDLIPFLESECVDRRVFYDGGLIQYVLLNRRRKRVRFNKWALDSNVEMLADKEKVIFNEPKEIMDYLDKIF